MNYSPGRHSTHSASQFAVLATCLAETDEICSICGKTLGNNHACLYDLPASLLTMQDPRIGTIVGDHYMLEEHADEGDTCLIYKARHELSNAIVAAKIMRTAMPIDQITVLRGHRAARIAAGLDHPNIARTIELAFDADQEPILIMEWSQGSPLSAIIAQEAPLPPLRALNIIEQVVGALTYARYGGINHIRLKPSTIMVQRENGFERAKVIDFGIMKMLSVQKASQVTDTSAYRSPEERAGHAPDEHSSMYSVGVILYEMLSEKFDDTVFNTGGKQGLPALIKLRPHLQAAALIDDLLFKCMATRPQDRFGSLDHLSAAIEKLKSEVERLGQEEVAACSNNDTRASLFVKLILVLLTVAAVIAALLLAACGASAALLLARLVLAKI